MGIGSKRQVNAERLLFFYEDTVCVYPAQSFDDFKYSDTDWKAEDFWKAFKGNKPEKYYIERNAEDYFGGKNQPEPTERSGSRFVTFYTPLTSVEDLEGGEELAGIIGLQLSQSDYDELLPSTVLEEPYQLSFISVFDMRSGDLIWSKTVETAINGTVYFNEVYPKIREFPKDPTEQALKKNRVNLTDDEYFNTYQEPSPLDGITRHTHYNEKYEMFVVCGQEGKLSKDIKTNLEGFIETDLLWFQIILLFFNVLIFVAFLFFFESRLQIRVTKPI